MGGIWRPGDRSSNLEACSPAVLANWLLCVVINFTTQATEQVTFSSDPIGGDGIIHHDASGFAVPTEHVFVPPGGAAAAGNIENLILAKIQQKHVKGGEAYVLAPAKYSPKVAVGNSPLRCARYSLLS
jgi:hypothetical protein